MKSQLLKVYEPQKVEGEIYRRWEESGFFNPDNLEGEPYSIMMPPPNVTGVLHLGHALENTLMDAMARFQRMRGKKVLLLPGTDHAAVATQAKVEKILVAEGMKNPRQELGREKLLERIREYAENSKATILTQIRKLGTSCDWSRLAYTFDEKRSRAVNEVFVRMYQDGLIYRGYRVVNWSIKGQSTCSDDELVRVERPAKLYTFRYSKDFPISIATTRPETKLGDTAVAVNPEDKRYSRYIGRIFEVEIGAAQPLRIKIIANEQIDPAFGTGAVGVTPAHSPVDFELYENQKASDDPIDLIPIIDEQGKMTARAGKAYAGLTVLAARDKFVTWLEKEGLLEKTEDITQNVGTSDRFGDAVEALPMTQWFVDVNKEIPGKNKSLKALMREAASTGHNGDPKQKISITPERFRKMYFNWIDNLHDWCISRQVWWGHRIPVWYRGEEVCCAAEIPGGKGWQQDPDTLDTWFSSGLWTFSTLGWPDNNTDLEKFHPTSWMQMGYEILFFWMARMILMSTYALDQIPFRDAYIHGMLRSEDGKKFSKSAGNNIDPIEIVERHGADALRLSLISGITPGNDSKFYEEKTESSRNFVNKLWNISRYILATFPEKGTRPERSALLPSDLWVMHRFSGLIASVNDDFEHFQFSQAAEKLRDFTWKDLADWYLEIAKFEDNKDVKNWILRNILESLLKLWHPFIPFVTEHVWSNISKEGLLLAEKWPEDIFRDLKVTEGSEGDFNLVQEVIAAIRNIRLENKLRPNQKVDVTIQIPSSAGQEIAALLEKERVIIQKLRTGIRELTIKNSDEPLPDAYCTVVQNINIFIPHLKEAEDARKNKLAKEIASLEDYAAGLRERLKNDDFISKAPALVIENQRKHLRAAEDKLNELRKQA